MKKVSVIVPVYNVEQYVAKCLKSIQNQTLEDFECLVINDGTKDNSVSAAKKAVQGDERFLFFDKENGGLSDARNYGSEKAQGEYICYIDSDDYIDERLLELTYASAKEHDSDIVVFDMMYEYEDHSDYSSGAGFEGCTSYKENPNLLFINNSANNKLYRTSFMMDKRFIKGMWYEDMAVIPVWLAKANKVSHVNKPLYYYVQRSGSITHNADERLFDIFKSVSIIKEELNLDSRDLKTFYFEDCLRMTLLRIRDFDDAKQRHAYYRHEADLMDFHYPSWFMDAFKEDYSFKAKLIFTFLKLRMIAILDIAYRK